MPQIIETLQDEYINEDEMIEVEQEG